MGKKKNKSKKNQPWYRFYNHLNFHSLIRGRIPKLFRAVNGARARLHAATTARAADAERRHLRTKLAVLDGAYSKIRNALRDGGDLYRWREFPGLEAAVRRVNNLDWCNVQDNHMPGGPFIPTLTKFHDELSFRHAEPPTSKHVTTGPAVKGMPFQRLPVSEEVGTEEGEIKEEDEVKIKHEPEDEPGVPDDIGPPEHLHPPDFASNNHGSQRPAHSYNYPYQTGFGDCFESPPYWMPQLPFAMPVPHPRNWQPLPEHLRNPSFPAFYPFIPDYNFDFVNSEFNDRIGRGNPQLPYSASHPHVHASRQHLIEPGAIPVGASIGASEPFPSLQPPITAPKGPTLPSKMTTPPNQSTSQLLKSVSAKQTDVGGAGKRKLSTSMEALFDTNQALKHLCIAQGSNMSGDDDNRHIQSRLPRPTNGLPDFGTWFQDQVADSKKKLSNLERVSARTGNIKIA